MRAIFKLSVCLAFLACVAAAPAARADVAILLEEPYSLDGTLAGTGHTAVYLSNICAASPTQLRRCNPGELGVVLSRYHHVAGYDWLAVPLIPYLYAVENPEQIPLFADGKLVWFLRNQYRARYFSAFVPDPLPTHDKQSSDWYQLVGSAYDRTLYGFQLPTSPEDDDRFIAKFNSGRNSKAYKLVTDNCADFVHDVVTFYYPNSVWRSKLGDLGVMTPKQVAKSLVQYSKRNAKQDPQFQLTRFFIPQVPGTIKRSKPVHGLMDAFFHAKKYFVPLAVFQPFVAGGVASVCLFGGRFNPASGASLWTPDGLLGQPLTKDERKAWDRELQAIVKSDPSLRLVNTKSAWKPLQSSSEFHLDPQGHPVLQISSGDNTVNLGASRSNFLDSNAQNEARVLLVARLREELRPGRTKKSSDRLIRADFNLLQQTTIPSATLSVSSGGN
ncbi:MAG: hypothetical protein JSS69_18105 [Acidobacteria bacterium]|nr:hypothetical protein [Acidobacteriota bacterium]MBS1867829.1 hypothetical protein [Acidobacteriota bacterium]